MHVLASGNLKKGRVTKADLRYSGIDLLLLATVIELNLHFHPVVRLAIDIEILLFPTVSPRNVKRCACTMIVQLIRRWTGPNTDTKHRERPVVHAA